MDGASITYNILQWFLRNADDSWNSEYKDVVDLDWSGWDYSLEPEEIADSLNLLTNRLAYTRDCIRKPVIIFWPWCGAHAAKLVDVTGWGHFGSGATVYVNNVCNVRRSIYVSKKLGIQQFRYKVSQDDTLWAGLNLGSITPDRLEDAIAAFPNAKLDFERNDIKSFVGTSTCLHNTTRFGRLYRPLFELYLNAIYPEQVVDPSMSSQRLRGIYEASHRRFDCFLITPKMFKTTRFIFGLQTISSPPNKKVLTTMP